MKRLSMRVLGWLLAVMAATAIGLAAVSLLTEGLTSRSTTPLSHDAVSDALALSTEAPKNPPARPPAHAPAAEPTQEAPTKRTITQSMSSPGGTIIARCTATTAYLVAWTPAQGFSVDKYERGPAESVLVQFDGNDEEYDDAEITMTVTCPADEPVAAVITLAD